MINRILLFLLLSSVTVFAALPPFANAPSQWQNNSQGINYSKNVGIGSSNPGTALDTSGTIRTNSLIAIGNGNTGIGTLNPGQLLDVAGTARVLGFNMPTGASSGYILTSNGVGVGTWAPANSGGSSQWTTANTNDVYLPNSGNVGIGTTITNQGAALEVWNGNIGIGTLNTSAQLTIGGPAGTQIAVIAPSSTGNAGISLNARYLLRYNGAAGNDEISDNASGKNIAFIQSNITTMYLTAGHNVGIGTTSPGGALAVMSGNVGIGTWMPRDNEELMANNGTQGLSISRVDIPADIIQILPPGGSLVESQFKIGGSLALGISTNQVQIGTYINGNAGSLTTGSFIVPGNIGIGTLTPLQKLDVRGTVNVLNGGITANGNVGISGTGVTSCICHQFDYGVCTNATCT